jgi:probable HAF family extracellular repeat protein
MRTVRFWLMLVSLYTLRAANALAASYTITDLGTPGGPRCQALAINNSGQVTGSVDLPGGAQAYVWTPTTPNGTTGRMVDVGVLDGSASSVGVGINSSGELAAVLSFNGDPNTHSIVYDGTAVHYIGPVPGGTKCDAMFINDSGHVTGQCNSPGGIHPFLYDGNTSRDLGLLGTGDFGWGFGINNYGQVAGFGDTTVDGVDSRAFLWQPTTPNSSTGVMHDLGTLGGSFAAGFGLSSRGQVTGYSTNPGDAETHAMVWTPTTPNGITGDMTDIGTLGGTYAQGNAINAGGQVLGYSTLTPADNVTSHYFLYTPGSGMVDFQTLIDPLSGWDATSLTPNAINDAGQIVGTGFIGADYHAFLLTPVPEPASSALAALGVLGLSVTRLLRHRPEKRTPLKSRGSFNARRADTNEIRL